MSEKADIGRRAANEVLRLIGKKPVGVTLQLLGVADATFRGWAAGRATPRAETLARLHEAGADVVYILTGRRTT